MIHQGATPISDFALTELLLRLLNCLADGRKSMMRYTSTFCLLSYLGIILQQLQNYSFGHMSIKPVGWLILYSVTGFLALRSTYRNPIIAQCRELSENTHQSLVLADLSILYPDTASCCIWTGRDAGPLTCTWKMAAKVTAATCRTSRTDSNVVHYTDRQRDTHRYRGGLRHVQHVRLKEHPTGQRMSGIFCAVWASLWCVATFRSSLAAGPHCM